jgi:hypothetical protein
MVPSLGFSSNYILVIETPATADATNTILFSLAEYGTVVGGTGFDVTTGSIEALGIALSGDTYTITVGTGDDAARAYVLTMMKG